METKTSTLQFQKEELWNDFFDLLEHLPRKDWDTLEKQIRTIAEEISYPSEELEEYFESEFSSSDLRQQTINNMMRLEEELTYGN